MSDDEVTCLMDGDAPEDIWVQRGADAISCGLAVSPIEGCLASSGLSVGIADGGRDLCARCAEKLVGNRVQSQISDLLEMERQNFQNACPVRVLQRDPPIRRGGTTEHRRGQGLEEKTVDIQYLRVAGEERMIGRRTGVG